MNVKLQRNPGKCRFKKCCKRYKYVDSKRTDEQETTTEGIPIWNITAEIFQDGEDVDRAIVAVPMDRNPAEGLQYNEDIVFKDFAIVSGPRAVGGGRWECLRASSVVRHKRGSGE